MSAYETLLTPATYVSSDAGIRASPEAPARHRGRWKSGPRKQSSPQLLTSKASSDGPPKVVKKRPSTSNVVKRAIHKIGKKARKPSSHPPPSASASVDMTPPKIEDLGIEPRLLEKWKERKELKKQAEQGSGGARGKPPASRGAATLVVVGLSSGSVAWTKERLRDWSRANGAVLAACIVAAAVAIACALILRRCSG